MPDMFAQRTVANTFRKPSSVQSKGRLTLSKIEWHPCCLSIELAMTMHVSAANFRVDEDTLARLRGKCVNEVKRLNGKISFDDAVRYQKGR